MKIFATSDIHGEESFLKAITKIIKKNKIDRVYFCGDLTPHIQASSAIDLGNQQRTWWEVCFNEWAKETSKKYNCQIIAMLGNDDWFWHKDKSVIAMYGNYPTMFEQLHMPYTNIYIGSMRERAESEISYELEQLHNPKGHIILSHEPPYGTKLDVVERGNVGSLSVRNFIQLKNPEMWLCGHIHESYGYEKINSTHVFNCACLYHLGILRGFIIDYQKNKVKDFEPIRMQV